MSFVTKAVFVWLILGAALFAMLRTLKENEDGPEDESPPLWMMALAYGFCVLLCTPVALIYFVVGTIAGAR